jgi:hypothetical protein
MRLSYGTLVAREQASGTRHRGACRIYDKCRDGLLILAIALSHDVYIAEDAVHDVFVNMTTEVFTIPFELTEKHLVQALAIEAKSFSGRFPILWMGGRPGQEALDASIAEFKTAVPVEEADDTMLGTEYIKRLPQGSEWQYLGEGVRLGAADKPVFWYRTPGSKTGRVIYGDLSVRDVASEDLPQAT